MNPADQYISTFPSEVQLLLHQIREAIQHAAPQATVNIAYRMLAWKTNGKPLVYLAAYKNHIGFYATPSGHERFAQRLAGYKQGKGSVQFPLNQPIPIDLISEIVAYRVIENELTGRK